MPEQPNPTEIDQPTPSEQQPGAAYPDVPAEAWSGVHRGPLREGEWVLVKGRWEMVGNAADDREGADDRRLRGSIALTGIQALLKI